MTILPKTTSDIALLAAGTTFKASDGTYRMKTDSATQNNITIATGVLINLPNGTMVTVDVGGAYQTGNA